MYLLTSGGIHTTGTINCGGCRCSLRTCSSSSVRLSYGTTLILNTYLPLRTLCGSHHSAAGQGGTGCATLRTTPAPSACPGGCLPNLCWRLWICTAVTDKIWVTGLRPWCSGWIWVLGGHGSCLRGEAILASEKLLYHQSGYPAYAGRDRPSTNQPLL